MCVCVCLYMFFYKTLNESLLCKILFHKRKLVEFFLFSFFNLSVCTCSFTKLCVNVCGTFSLSVCCHSMCTFKNATSPHANLSCTD